MRSVDTNILARLIVADDPRQSELAATIVEQPVFVPITVTLELVWLLSSRYGLTRDEVVDALLTVFAIRSVDVEAYDLVRWALDRFRLGAGFGDMIHLIAARHTAALITFDKSLAKDAGPDTPLLIELLA